MYLFDSTQEFFDSPMWKGERFYDAKPYRPWFGWIYVALYDHVGVEEYKKDPNPDAQIKIGQTSNIDRRNKELFRNQTSNGKTQKKASIVYAWSVPLSIKFENDIKTLLAAYIRKDNTRTQSSEIIWGIPIIPLINIIQLSIFKTCLSLRFIRTDVEFNLRPPDTILDASIVYAGARKYIVPHQLVMDDIFAQLDIEKGDTEPLFDYIFLQDDRIATQTQEPEQPKFEDTYEDVPEFITETTFMKRSKVYPIGAYVNAQYVDRFDAKSNHLALIVGYAGGDTVKNQYAIKWLLEDNGNPVKDGDAFEFTRDPWEYTKKVFKIKKARATKFNIPLKTQVPRLYSLRL